ncbi:MAG: hypothetical protein HQK54_12780 [Oligoflexales bacterium]|nr:hypothetical protein [Oligoflexales bacterium]
MISIKQKINNIAFFCILFCFIGCENNKDSNKTEMETPTKAGGSTTPTIPTKIPVVQPLRPMDTVRVDILDSQSLNEKVKNGSITVNFQLSGEVSSGVKLLCRAGKESEIADRQFSLCSGGTSHVMKDLEENQVYIIAVKPVKTSTGAELGVENHAAFLYKPDTGSSPDGKNTSGSDDKDTSDSKDDAPPTETRQPIVRPVGWLNVQIPTNMYEQEFSSAYTLNGMISLSQVDDDPFGWAQACKTYSGYHGTSSFVDQYGVSHKRCSISLSYSDYLRMTNNTMARNHIVISTPPSSLKAPGRDSKNIYIGYERMVVNAYVPMERVNPFDPQGPEKVSDTSDLFLFLCSPNYSDFKPALLPGFLGLKTPAYVRVCKSRIADPSPVSSQGTFEMWIIQFFAPSITNMDQAFCSGNCPKDPTSLEIIYIAQWDIAATAGELAQLAYKKVSHLLSPGGVEFSLPSDFTISQ